jgi:peptide/nickel transport system substrate-binding protein
MPEETTRLASLKTGEIDISECDLESVGELEASGLRTPVVGRSMNAIYFYGVYEKEAAGLPTADLRVRQALSLAINRDEIINSFYQGKAGPPTPPMLMDGSADIDAPYWDIYAANTYRYNLEEAKQLLKEAGYPNGFTFKLWNYEVGGTNLPKLAQIVQGYWLKIGVKAEIVPIDKGSFDKWRNVGPDKPCPPEILGQASPHNNGFRPATALQLVRGFGSRVNKVFGTTMPELDKLMDSATTEMDAGKRKEIVAKATKIILDSYACLVIANVPDMCVIGPAVDIKLPDNSAYFCVNLEIAKHRK